MSKGFFKTPTAKNETVKTYANNTPERDLILDQYKYYNIRSADIPMFIGSEEIRTNKTKDIRPPHDHDHVIGRYHLADKKHVVKAIKCALSARSEWANLDWEQRTAIFLKAADLISGPYRYKINAATMLAQSKTVHQAEIFRHPQSMWETLLCVLVEGCE